MTGREAERVAEHRRLRLKIDCDLHDAINLAEMGTPLRALLEQAHADIHDLAYSTGQQEDALASSCAPEIKSSQDGVVEYGRAGEMDTLGRALSIAHEAHAGQVDKTGRPYIEHVLRVVDAVEGEDAKVVAALHDVLEDCPEWTTQRLVRAGIPASLVDDVWTLTRTDEVSAKLYYRHIAARPWALAVKLADVRDNVDPARLALLPKATRERLTRKYAAALAQLGAA